MRVYVVRHGESENNTNGRFSGWYDTVLTERGREQAEALTGFLSKATFDKVYSSDLSRARDTATLSLGERELLLSPLLREINVGYIANTPRENIPLEERRHAAKVGYAAYGGETWQQLNDRVAAFMRQLEGETCACVAVFCHEGFLRAFLDAVIELEVSRAHMCCGNCTVGIFDYADGKWRLHSWINRE